MSNLSATYTYQHFECDLKSIQKKWKCVLDCSTDISDPKMKKKMDYSALAYVIANEKYSSKSSSHSYDALFKHKWTKAEVSKLDISKVPEWEIFPIIERLSENQMKAIFTGKQYSMPLKEALLDFSERAPKLQLRMIEEELFISARSLSDAKAQKLWDALKKIPFHDKNIFKAMGFQGQLSMSCRNNRYIHHCWLSAAAKISQLAQEEKPLTLARLLEIHSKLLNSSENLLRTKQMAMTSRKREGVYLVASKVKEVFSKTLSELEKEIKKLKKNKRNPLPLAFKTYQKIVAIHPVIDGNGRMARLLMDYVLIRLGLVPPLLEKMNSAIVVVHNGTFKNTSLEDIAGFAKALNETQNTNA